MRETLFSLTPKRFWPLLALALLLFVVGIFLWYSVDGSEIYFKNYEIESFAQAPAEGAEKRCAKTKLPWWQFDLAPGDTLRIPLRLPVETPDGRWFVEILGHPVDARSGGSLDFDGHAIEVGFSQGPRWQRVYLDTRPAAPRGVFSLRYDAVDAGARFRLWGTYGNAQGSKRRTARVISDAPRSATDQHRAGSPRDRAVLALEGPESVLLIPEPLPFRQGNLAPEHEVRWRTAHTRCSVDPYFRVGLRTQLVSRKWIGDKLILISVGLVIGLLLASFAAFAIRHPVSGAAVVVITLAAFWLRWSVVGSLADQYERSVNGLTVRHSLWADSANYFWLAMRIFSNETPARLLYPIGMPAFSSYLFQWNGIDHVLPKYGFALLHTLVGPALFFACREVVRFKALAFLPLLIWSGFLRPIKYSYFYLTESLGMCLLIAWVAILISRDPRAADRCPNWPWVVVSSSILFVLSSYSRDIIITFLPVFLGMIWIFAGGRPNHRLASTLGALVVVVGLWCANPVLFSNKSFSLKPIEFLAVTPGHYRTATMDVLIAEESVPEYRRLERPRETLGEVSVLEMLEGSLGELADGPRSYLEKSYSRVARLWSPHYRWAQIPDFKTTAEIVSQRKRESRSPSLYSLGEPNVRSAHENSVPARYLLGDNPGGNYARLLMLAAVTAVFGFIFSPRWRVVAGVLLYTTLFQLLLFHDPSARPRAIFFPVIVLLASLGVFAVVEPFSAWLRARWRSTGAAAAKRA